MKSGVCFGFPKFITQAPRSATVIIIISVNFQFNSCSHELHNSQNYKKLVCFSSSYQLYKNAKLYNYSNNENKNTVVRIKYIKIKIFVEL